MLRMIFKLVSMSFKALIILILAYLIPFMMIVIIDRTIGIITIYTFCLGYLCLFIIIILFSLFGNHIKKERGI